jgi:hypothetical protein
MRYRAAGRTTVQEVPLQMHARTVKVLLAATASALVLGTGAASAAAAARTHQQAASAQVTPADEQYGGPGGTQGGGGDVLGEQSGGGTGGLPFTGLNLLLVLGAGSGLIASGLGLRAASYRHRRS